MDDEPEVTPTQRQGGRESRHLTDLEEAAADRARERLARRFTRQAEAAVARTSPLYEHLFIECAQDIRRGGLVWDLLAARAHEPAGRALPLRLMAAVHLLTLDGLAPQLDRFYPSRGGRQSDGVWPAFLTTLSDNASVLNRLLDRPVQTNEVGRSKAVVAGIEWLTQRVSNPVLMWEIGASAGLNLNWQHYGFYAGGQRVFGPRDSPVTLHLPTGLALGHLDGRVHETVGCDREPIDPNDADGIQWLRACVWADHITRLDLLDSALTVARRSPPRVEAGEASSWLRDRLRGAPSDKLIVVTQSVVNQYLSADERTEISDAVTEAGNNRAAQTMAWLTVEPAPPGTNVAPQHRGLTSVRVSLWPHQLGVLLGHIDFHGRTLTLSDTYHRTPTKDTL